MVLQFEISLPPVDRGFHLITQHIIHNLPELPETGVLHLFIKHTSAAISINENADITVRSDLNDFFNKLVPEKGSHYRHSSEGEDDMPAHIKSSIIGFSISIPISNRKLNLGKWQGIYLCEFRNYGGSRKLVATIIS